MNRRTFMATAGTGGLVALLGGGFWARQALARNQIQQELNHQADPILTNYAAQQLAELPSRAREEMRRHFHGLCLNVHEFTAAVCSPEFPERLARHSSPEARQQLLVSLFMAHVTTPNAVLNRVHLVAEEISKDLDRNWTACCGELADQWNLKLSAEHHLNAEQMTNRLTPVVNDSIRQVLEQAKAAGQPVALNEMANEIGKSALLLLPLAMVAPWVGWPLFVVFAVKPVFDVFIQQARDRAATLQATVTDKLAQLGNRVGSEFENEVRLRLADLHLWQRHAVDTAARQQAEQLVRWL